jgi:peptidyl-prolyl cis-trans isomerase-like protein 2
MLASMINNGGDDQVGAKRRSQKEEPASVTQDAGSPGASWFDLLRSTCSSKLFFSHPSRTPALPHSPIALTPTVTMGKNTDKLYITHSEWSSSDAFGNSRGANTGGRHTANGLSSTFKRLPFNYCAVSLQPFTDPVCTSTGTIFDLTHILTWLSKHENTNPVDGTPLKRSDLFTLNYTKNEDGEYVDPVTYKVFTDNTHIVALKNSGNVFSWDTVERLNIKAKNWRDLLSDEEFSRKDIITLQDPQNIESRDFGSYKHIKDGSTLLPDTESSVNTAALGSASNLKVMKAKEAVAKARAERAAKSSSSSQPSKSLIAHTKNGTAPKGITVAPKAAYNAAVYTSGKAAASFTSTGMTPHTSGERALLSLEDYMLVPKRIKQKGYARISTSLGDLNIELLPEFAPKAVWNFVQLAKKGYYCDTLFHRNIKNFMLQGGDPTGTGRGGESIWGKPFNDEFDGPEKHDKRGMISMANKGKNTNTSQFFITYRAVPHLDRKHTIFARVVGGLDTTLSKMENSEVGEKDRPVTDMLIEDVVVFVDPFEEWQKERKDKENKEIEEEQIRKAGGRADERTTWTGKRIRADGKVESGEGEGAGVGKYLKKTMADTGGEDEIVGIVEEEPVRKKTKVGGFGNFDAW